MNTRSDIPGFSKIFNYDSRKRRGITHDQNIVATILLSSINTAISQDNPNPCGKPGNLCNISFTLENKTDSTDSDKKGYCGTSRTSASIATTGCLCPNDEESSNTLINSICQKAIRDCNDKCQNSGSCATPNNSTPPGDSQCVCAGPY